MQAVGVSHQLAPHGEHSPALVVRLEVGPREPQDLPAAKAEGQGQVVGRSKPEVPDGLEEPARLLGGERAALAEVHLGAFRDRGHVADQQAVLLGDAQRTTQRGAG